MCSHKISLWTPRTRGLTCLHEISCGAPPLLPTPAGSPSPPTQQPLVFSSPGSPSHPLVFSLLGSRRSPHATSASPWASTYAHPARAAEKGKKHHRQIAPAISLCRSLPLVRPPRTHAHENRSDSPLPRLLPCPSLLDHGLRIYTPQVPAQPPAAPIRLARERHSPLALISNCPSTRRARRYICHSAAASTPGAPTPIETDYPLEFSEDTTYWRTTPRRCPPATTGPPWTLSLDTPPLGSSHPTIYAPLGPHPPLPPIKTSSPRANPSPPTEHPCGNIILRQDSAT